MTTHAGRRSAAVPPRARTLTVARSRLVQRLLDEDGPVVVVTAPAGSGKSVLVRQWVDADPRPHAVVALQPWSDAPIALAEQLIAGLDPLGPSLEELRTIATGEEPRFSALLLPALAAAMGSRDEPCLLVLDDVHLLIDPRCHVMLEQLAAAVPPGSQLALVTRNATPAWLARTRAAGDLVEVGAADLAFHAGEAEEVLAVHGVPATPALVDRVLDETEGWPVAVYLVALLMSGAGDEAEAVDRLSGPVGRGRAVRDYLRSQVLDPLDEETRAFLRATSILDLVEPALCDAMLGRADSLAVLRRLARAIQLVVPLDESDTAFRYHHLLQEVLRDELDEVSPQSVPGLHSAAASWYDQHGSLDAAVRHAALSGDVALAGGLIAHNLGEPVGRGNPDLLEEWLRPLDDRTLGSDPLLAVSRCWLAIQRGDDTDVTAWLRRAQQLVPQWRQHAGVDPVAAAVAATALVGGREPLRDFGRIADAVTTVLPPELAFVSAANVVAFVVTDLLGVDHDANDHRAQTALARSRAYDVPSVEANVLGWQALMHLLDGDVASARPLQDLARDIMVESHLDRLATSGVVMSIDALYLACTGRFDEATEALGAARRQSVGMAGILHWFPPVGALMHAVTYALLGERASAQQLLAVSRAELDPAFAHSARVGQLVAMARSAMADAPGPRTPAPAVLTAAELRVLQFLPSHLTLPQIAGRLFLSTNTVKTHVQAAYRKLDVVNRDDAVSAARRLGLLEPLPDIDTPRRDAHPVRVDPSRSTRPPTSRW